MTLRPASTQDSTPWNLRRFGSSPTSSTRSSFEVDRDRVLHSATFRELQYKTQVQSLVSEGASRYFRTRLNHVIEVAQIARALASAVGADGALAEAIALAHDLGHPPFGHAGERALSEGLKAHGRDGWNANVHSLAVVDHVEVAFSGFRGLDLTFATREGIARHSTPFDEPISFGEFAMTPSGGLECQIVDVADVFAYITHDLDDALASRLVTIKDLEELPIIGELLESATTQWESNHRVWTNDEMDVVLRRQVIARMLSRLIRHTAESTASTLEANQLDALGVRSRAQRTAMPPTEYETAVDSLLKLLVQRYYRSPQVADADQAAASLTRQLLEALIAEPARVPLRFHQGGAGDEVDEVDAASMYLASLNDFAAVELARELGIEPAEVPRPKET